MTDNYWTRLDARSRVGRRRFLAGTGTVLVGATGLTLVGCGDDDDDGGNGNGNGGPSGGNTPGGGFATPVEGISDYPSYTSVVKAADYIQKYNWRNLPKPQLPARKGGKYTQAIGLIPPHFDPFGPLAASYPVPTNLRQIYNQLTRLKMEWDDNLDQAVAEGELSESWENPDDLTLTFKLRPGVKFQDIAPVNGRAFTSEDVKYTFESYRDKSSIAGYFDNVDAITTPDANTLSLKFKQPAAYFLNLISGPSTSILPKELDEQGRRENPVGTGPFQLKGGVFKPNQEATYVRNPNYWEVRDGITLPYLDSVTMVNPPDPTVALEGFRNGQYDSSAYAFNFDLLDGLLDSNPDTIVQIVSDHPSTSYYIGLNHDNPKWKDERVRRALAYAVDIQQIIDLGLEGAAAPGCVVDWASMGMKFPPQLKEMDEALASQNVDKAKQLLKEAGQENLKVSIMFASTDTRGQAIFSLLQQQLQAAGIELSADTRDATTVSNTLYGGNVPDTILATQLPAGPDADVFTYQLMHSKGASNYFHIKDSELDDLTLKQRSILDPAQRQAAIKDIWLASMKKMVIVPIASPAYIRVRQPWLNNWQNHRYLDPLGWGAHIHGLMWFGDNAPADRRG